MLSFGQTVLVRFSAGPSGRTGGRYMAHWVWRQAHTLNTVTIYSTAQPCRTALTALSYNVPPRQRACMIPPHNTIQQSSTTCHHTTRCHVLQLAITAEWSWTKLRKHSHGILRTIDKGGRTLIQRPCVRQSHTRRH